MIVGIRRAAALTALIAFAAPAYADWETTNWGMSPDETLAALDGASSHTPAAAELFEYAGATYAPLVTLPHAVDGIEGEATLLFDTSKALQFVVFTPGEIADCDALGAALTERYGDTDATGFGATAIYNWEDGGDIVRFTNSTDAGFCNLNYGPS